MKKVINLVLVLGLLMLVYQFFVMFLIKSFNTTYVLKIGNDNYTISEKYTKNKKNNLYSFIITNNTTKDKYIYNLNRDYNKQTNIIKDLKVFQQDSLTCIYPVFKDKDTLDPICKYGNDLVTYSYLQQINNNYINSFISSLQENNIDINEYRKDTSFMKEDTISIASTLPEEFIFTMWYYHGLYTIKDNSVITTDLFSKDLYENIYGRIVDRYYVTVDNDSSFDYDKLFLVDIVNGGKDYINIDNRISFNSYILGVINNKMYIVDKDNKKEYEIDVNNKTAKQLDSGIYYENGKVVNKSIDDIISNNLVIDEDVISSDIINYYGTSNIKESNNKYYFQINNDVYYSLKSNKEVRVKLFSLDNFKEFKVVGDSVFGISGSTIYMYNDKYGLKQIIKNNELLYNSKNIYEVYQK